MYYFCVIYTIRCLTQFRCFISPTPPLNENIILTDELINQSIPDSVDLNLSPDLASFVAHFLYFLVFHFTGLLLCKVCNP